MDRLSDFKLAMGDEIKANKDWRGVGRPQVAMHRNCHIFSCLVFTRLDSRFSVNLSLLRMCYVHKCIETWTTMVRTL